MAVHKLKSGLLATAIVLATGVVQANDLSELGKSLTPVGAEKKGNAAGTIPDWTGGLNSIPKGFNPETDYIRVGVKSGGCSGLEYVLKFDNEKTEADQVFEDNGVKIVVDKKSFLYLVGTTLEYSGGLNGKGFVFNNPNAARTCGCGESFSL